MSFKLAQSETVHIMVHFSFELKNVTIKRMPSMMALGNNACRVILINRDFEAMLNERAEGYDMDQCRTCSRRLISCLEKVTTTFK